MTLIMTYPGSNEEPAEWESNNPVGCVICYTPWDADDQVGEDFTYHNETGEVVCFGKCYEMIDDRLEGELEDDYVITFEDAA